jgi:hypothetical protein
MDAFIATAPDTNEYLVIKVALVVGVFGLLRLNEMVDLTFESMQMKDDMAFFTIVRYFNIFLALKYYLINV